MDTLYLKQRAKLVRTINKLRNKLNNDDSLTDGQYNCIRGIYKRKISALREDRVY